MSTLTMILRRNLAIATNIGDLFALLSLLAMVLSAMLCLQAKAEKQSREAAEKRGAVLQEKIDQVAQERDDQAAKVTRLSGELDETRDLAAHYRQAAADAGRQAEQSERELDELSSKLNEAIRVVVYLDLTGSMTQAKQELASAVTTSASVLSRLGRSVEVAIVGGREDLVAEYGLAQVHPADQDSGASTKALADFLDTLDTSQGYVNLPRGVGRAIELAEQGPFDGRTVVLLLSDMDGREAATALRLGSQGSIESGVIAQLSAWAAPDAKQRRVVAFYAGPADAEPRAFYQRIGAEAPGAVMAEDVMSLLEVLLAAAQGD